MLRTIVGDPSWRARVPGGPGAHAAGLVRPHPRARIARPGRPALARHPGVSMRSSRFVLAVLLALSGVGALPSAARAASPDAAGAGTVAARDAVPPPSCAKPVVPAQLTTEAVAAQLQADVDRYKACIQGYVDLHTALARRHQDAANAAVDEFNAFVKHDLPKNR